MAAKPGRLSIAGVTIVLLLSIIAQSHLSGRGEVVETFSYDDPEIRITSPNQSIHSIPNLEINDFILASPPLPDGLRIIQNSSTLFGNVIDSYGQRTCAISPSVGINCWEFSEGEINIIDGLGNGSRIFGSVGVGRNHTCAVEVKNVGNRLFCWGENINGQVGDTNQAFPVGQVEIIHPDQVSWKKTIAGSDHSCGLDIYGGVYCWGNGAYGQLGRLEQALSRQPVKIGFGVGSTVDRGQEKITDISSGSFHICATSSLSKIYCWGWNGLGQLGLGFYSNSHIPMRVDLPAGFTLGKVLLGGVNSCVEDIESIRVICWGSNQFGQIEDSPILSFPEPVELYPEEGRQIVVGDTHLCFIRSHSNTTCIGGVDIELSLEIDEMLVFSSGEGYFCFVGSDNYISCNGEEINWDRNKIPVAISSMKVVTTILGGSIVGIASQNSTSNHLIFATNQTEIAAEITIKIEFGNDSDGDGWNDFDEKDCGMDAYDANIFPSDWDDDGVCDSNDWDDDGDFVADVNDVFPYDENEWRDDDRDGIGRNSDSLEITGAMFGAIITIIFLLTLTILEIKSTFFNKSVETEE